jgi:putative peptidoglycan lipid II flippase
MTAAPGVEGSDVGCEPVGADRAHAAEPHMSQPRAPEQGVVDAEPESAPPTRGFLARAAFGTAAFSVLGSLLGLIRDQSLARLFGAGRDTDAFLVAWTVPEFAATLLIEDGLAFALVPAFSVALARRTQGAPGDPVRAGPRSSSRRSRRGCETPASPSAAPGSPPPAC